MEIQLSSNASHAAGLIEQEVRSLAKECSPVKVRGISVLDSRYMLMSQGETASSQYADLKERL